MNHEKKEFLSLARTPARLGITETGSPYTTAPVTPGDFSYSAKEFGRTKDVERVFSVKRGTLYNAEKLGLVRGVLLRLRGQKSGVKLWDMRSIEQWIRGEMDKH